MIDYKSKDSDLVISASVGPRGGALLARLGYMSENALEHERKKEERRERLDALRERKDAEARAQEEALFQ